MLGFVFAKHLFSGRMLLLHRNFTAAPEYEKKATKRSKLLLVYLLVQCLSLYLQY